MNPQKATARSFIKKKQQQKQLQLGAALLYFRTLPVDLLKEYILDH